MVYTSVRLSHLNFLWIWAKLLLYWNTSSSVWLNKQHNANIAYITYDGNSACYFVYKYIIYYRYEYMLFKNLLCRSDDMQIYLLPCPTKKIVMEIHLRIVFFFRWRSSGCLGDVKKNRMAMLFYCSANDGGEYFPRN